MRKYYTGFRACCYLKSKLRPARLNVNDLMRSCEQCLFLPDKEQVKAESFATWIMALIFVSLTLHLFPKSGNTIARKIKRSNSDRRNVVVILTERWSISFLCDSLGQCWHSRAAQYNLAWLIFCRPIMMYSSITCLPANAWRHPVGLKILRIT